MKVPIYQSMNHKLTAKLDIFICQNNNVNKYEAINNLRDYAPT
ncbi:hypothetical protein Riv7116_5250 [Rivularia sp. PCC 7116]|nr:hypothetical protein Riv7116_5250 [Rivularia sp. PCC 7116]